MKILFNHALPFALAHGGVQMQIEQTKAGLEAIGVEVEYLRWWDDRQCGDLIHHFGVAPAALIHHARAKGVPLAMTTILSATCNRTESQLRRQGRLVRTILKLPFGEGVKQQLTWRSFSRCSINIVGLIAEQRVLELVYGLPQSKVAIVPLGLNQIFLEAGPGSRDADFLICAGTITRQKNSVALARLAHQAQTPILFVGKPYFETDPYWHEFRALVDGRWVRHQPHLDDPAELVALLKSARGAVHMSDFENWCFTVHEAAACGLPVLLPDQNWSRERFGNQAHYFDRIGFSRRNVEILKQFYASAPSLPAPAIQLFSWTEVATQLKKLYEKLLNSSLPIHSAA